MIIEEKRYIVVYQDPSDNWVLSDRTLHSKKKHSIENLLNYSYKDFSKSVNGVPQIDFDAYEKACKEGWKNWQKDNNAKCIRVTLRADE